MLYPVAYVSKKIHIIEIPLSDNCRFVGVACQAIFSAYECFHKLREIISFDALYWYYIDNRDTGGAM
jgi:hypothetical protein